MVLAVSIKHHDPMLAWGVPEHLGIAFRMNQDGILVIELPRAAMVQAIGDYLAAVIPSRNERDHRRVGLVGGQPGGVLVIHHARSGLYSAAGLFLPEGGFQLRPVD